MEWFLDPDTGQVRERRVSIVYDPLGTVSWTAVLVAADEIQVPAGLFQPDWLDEPVEYEPGAPTATTIVEAADQSTTTVFGVDAPGTTTLVGGDSGECHLDELPDLSSAMPPGFSGPQRGVGGWGRPEPSLCARFWQGPEQGRHVTQQPGSSGLGYTPDGSVGGYRWGVIHEGFVLEHTGETGWMAYAYGIGVGDFDRFVDEVISDHPDGR